MDEMAEEAAKDPERAVESAPASALDWHEIGRQRHLMHSAVNESRLPTFFVRPDGRIVYANIAAHDHLGYEPEELIGLAVWDIDPTMTGERWAERAERVGRGRLVQFETLQRRKDDTRVSVEVATNRFEFMGEELILAYVTDLTERRQSEEALREAEARYRRIVEDMAEFVSRTAIDGKLTFVNGVCCHYFGYAQEELLGADVYDFIAEEDRDYVRKSAEALTPEAPTVTTVHRNVRADGEQRWIEWTNRGIFDDSRQLVGVQSTGRDVHEKRLAQEALEKAHAEVKRLRDQLAAENVYLREQIKDEQHFDEIVGESPAMRELRTAVAMVADTDATVLICGETGTGKELVARALHRTSARRERTLVKINCSAVSAGLVESELFGHEKGAFTGAHKTRPGRFEIADGGTIFLDEIGDLPQETQVKLLRVLQEREFERVGSSEPIRVDVRVIAATNRDLGRAIEEGSFRSDLYYRLNVFPIVVPPLRERGDDVIHLAQHFLALFGTRMGRTFRGFRQGALDCMRHHSWPGNVRELRNFIERAAIATPDDAWIDQDCMQAGPWVAASVQDGGEDLESVQKGHIQRVLQSTDWVIEGDTGAAAILGINPSTLRSRMKKLGIARDA